MLLIEHHGKELLASHGIRVPAGVFVPLGGDVSVSQVPAGPVMVKAQVASGGRGKAGAVQRAASLDEVARIVAKSWHRGWAASRSMVSASSSTWTMRMKPM